MRVAFFQMNVSWLNPPENLHKIRNICREISGSADLLVLPEMFSTGYVLDISLLDPTWQHEVIRELTSYALENNLTITGSIPFFNRGRWTNTMITVDKSGLIHQYDKIHLFTPAGESKEYSPGNHPSAWNYENWTIWPLICYDLRFPYASFSTENPHVLLYSANWLVSRIAHWDALLKARAIENQCYVIGVNRFGADENGYDYPGHSSVYDYEGNRLSFAENREICLIADLSMDKLTSYREKLPFFKDRRTLP